jgi:hypothetical protein
VEKMGFNLASRLNNSALSELVKVGKGKLVFSLLLS